MCSGCCTVGQSGRFQYQKTQGLNLVKLLQLGKLIEVFGILRDNLELSKISNLLWHTFILLNLLWHTFILLGNFSLIQKVKYKKSRNLCLVLIHSKAKGSN